jgi:Pentapeptide repeats (8 copies)
MQPGSKTGSVEFAHKSFSEFLFADRLKEAIKDWTDQREVRRQMSDRVEDKAMHWQLYDLLGYGGLTPEIVEYLMALLTNSADFDPVRLFHRLEDFYLRWCDGEFIDELDSENLPQKKLRSLRDQVQEVGGAIGLRQVDVYTGLNVMILLVSVDQYARDRDDLKAKINFYPCGQQESRTIDVMRFIRITSYADCIFRHFFARRLGTYFEGIHLNGAILRGAYLCCTNFSGADLAGADLTSVNFGGADLSNANLSAASLKFVNFGMATLSDSPMRGATLIGANLKYANLSCANLTNTDLSGADLSCANLSDVSWNNGTKWQKTLGLETAQNVPIALKQQLGLP